MLFRSRSLVPRFSQTKSDNAMTAAIIFPMAMFLWFTLGMALPPPSLFREKPSLTREAKICINMGSKDEMIGPYQPESPSIYLPNGVALYKKIPTIKKNFKHERAFQLVRTLRNGLSFVVQADPWYRYNIQLGFIDVGKNCRGGGSNMKITVGGQQTRDGLTPTKTAGCSSPFFVAFRGVYPDSWNRIDVKFEGSKLSNFATICVEKDSSFFPMLKGRLYASADSGAIVFVNGVALFEVQGCREIESSETALKYDDVIAVQVTAKRSIGQLRVAFVVNGAQIFSTDDNGWKVRTAFPTTGNSHAWTSQDYIDSDWPDAGRIGGYCSPKEFLNDVTPIWSKTARVSGTVFFRYRMTR